VIAKLLGIGKPVVLAPMGMVTGGALAAAVSRAGGLDAVLPAAEIVQRVAP